MKILRILFAKNYNLFNKMDIIPLCLYENHNGNKLIDYPNLIRKDGQDNYVCVPKEGCRLLHKFYAVNPDYRPIPTGMGLFNVDNVGHETIDFDRVYDIFNPDHKGIKFLAWMAPVPYSSPLYITTQRSGTILTLNENSKKIATNISLDRPDNASYATVFVLFDNDADVRKILNDGRKFKVVDGVPQFLFKGYQGRCIPDPDGMELDKCVVLYNKNVLVNKDPFHSLRNNIYMEQKNKRSRNIVYIIIGSIIIIAMIIIAVYKRYL